MLLLTNNTNLYFAGSRTSPITSSGGEIVIMLPDGNETTLKCNISINAASTYSCSNTIQRVSVNAVDVVYVVAQTDSNSGSTFPLSYYSLTFQLR